MVVDGGDPIGKECRMDERVISKETISQEYEAPSVVDYGALQELTAGTPDCLVKGSNNSNWCVSNPTW